LILKQIKKINYQLTSSPRTVSELLNLDSTELSRPNGT